MNEPEESLPFSRCYWVVPDKLLAGWYPGSTNPEEAMERIQALLTHGIHVFVDLTEEGELQPYWPILYQEAQAMGIKADHFRAPVQDLDLPTADEMKFILDRIDQFLAQGSKVYLHCWGGIGRTGTVVGCYLVRHGKTGEEALEEIRRLRRYLPIEYRLRISPETEEQRQMILDWLVGA